LSSPGLPLNTPSLSIRPFVVEDAGEIFRLSHEAAYRTWLPNQVYNDASEARKVIEFLMAKYSDPGNPRLGPYVLAIEHRMDRTLIGHVGFSPFDGDVEIGFAIAERFQGRGLATEAVVAASQWALDTFALDRILGIASAVNIASKKTLIRARFAHQKDCLMPFQGMEQNVAMYVLDRDRPSSQGRVGSTS
jgi:RimJ/RimL family protein N-acetyltransferase